MVALFAHGEQKGKGPVRHLRRASLGTYRYNADMLLRIREIREAKGLTVEQLADAVGMSKSYLSEIERGKKTVNARRLEQLSRALGVRPTDLLADRQVSEDIERHLSLLADLPESVRREVFEFARFRARVDEQG